MQVGYGVFNVSLNSELYSASISALLYAKSCYVGLHIIGNRLCLDIIFQWLFSFTANEFIE